MSRFPARPVPGQRIFVPFPGKLFSGKIEKYNLLPDFFFGICSADMMLIEYAIVMGVKKKN